MHLRAPIPAEQVHWDGAKNEHAVLPIMGEGRATLPSEIEKDSAARPPAR
jgi:hypothetical protein